MVDWRMSLLFLAASCGGAVTIPDAMPPECVPTGVDAATCVDGSGGWRSCPMEDGSKWVFYPDTYLEGGYEHLGPAGQRVCRVWGNGAWAR